jgi:putative transposase
MKSIIKILIIQEAVKVVTKKRIWYSGCTYHITARGNHRNDIFRDDTDYEIYLMMMKESLKYY